MAFIVTSGSDTPKVVGFKGTHKIDIVFHYKFSRSCHFDVFCQDIRQDFDIYWNIDHQKAKKLKKETKEKRIRHTNNQASKQINKRTNKETGNTNNQTINVACFCWSDAMAGAITCGQTI